MRGVKQALFLAVLLFVFIGLAFSTEQKPAAPAAQPASGAQAAKATKATTAEPAQQATPSAQQPASGAPAAKATKTATEKSATPGKPTAPATQAKPATQAAQSIKSATPAAQAAPATTATSPSTAGVWAPADESDWAVYMDAPAYHFALAKEYLQKGDHAKAAAELKRANGFLNLQKKRLSIASKQIEELANKIAAGKEENLAKVEAVTSKALKVIDYKYAMLPVEVDATSVFADAYKYHFEKAKSKLKGDDKTEAAAEIKRAVSFLKLKATHIGHKAKADLDAVIKELKDLAAKVESGTVSDVKELDKVFQKATALFAKKK